MLKRRVGRMKCQWDECLEAASLILQAAQPDKMVCPVFFVLNVAVQHGRIGFQADLVRRACSLQPLLAINLVIADHPPHALFENLPAAPGKRIQPCALSWRSVSSMDNLARLDRNAIS